MEANLARADDRIVEINVAYWHKTETPCALANVCYCGLNGLCADIASGQLMTQVVSRCCRQRRWPVLGRRTQTWARLCALSTLIEIADEPHASSQ